MGLHQLAALPEYVRYLRENPQEGELLFKELLIGVTRFFRDPAVWEQLKTDVLPALLAEYPNGGALRAWVPACSTGEEAYSLAIAFREVLEQEKPEVNYSLQIFATDLFKEAIDKARTGAYPANITADVTEPRLRRYFSKAAHGYRVSKEIREMVIFAPQNVTMDPPFTKLDLLLCRNLLIYFEKDLQAKLLPLFHRSLNAGGVLVLGNAETVGQATDLFAPLPGKTRIFRRNEAARAFESVDFPEAFARRRTTGAAVAAAKAAPAPNVQALTESLLLKRYSPVAVLVTDKGDIVYVSGKTGKYLEPATGKANLNLFAMAREGLAGALNEAFARAVRQQATVVLKELTVGSDGGATTVDVTVQPLDDPAALRGMVLVVFSDVDTRRAGKASGKAPGKAPGKGPDKAMPAGASADRIRALTEEIQESREELQTTREEMLTSQEELKSTNEELQSTNEELQSTNEEQTTSKEEMQSMNEELQTVNHELTAKVDALSHASDDMANLLDSTDIATLFLDGDMKVRQFTTQTSDIIKLIPGDAGRPITDLATTLDYPTLADDAREVLRTLVFCEVQVSTRDARWFRVRTMPYRTQDDRIDGVVITFTDISVAKALEATLREAQSVLQSRFTDQTAELDTAKALEGVLQRAQALLEKRVTAQTLELRESRGDVEAGPSGSLQKEPRP